MSTLKPPVNGNDHIQGNPKAALELVEYGDYQCPYCGRAYPLIKHVQKKFGDQLKFVFRNFPLSEIHPNAYKAALAAEAAALQNKFWEMHDIIYENQHQLDIESLVHYAGTVGLKTGEFKNDMDKKSLSEKVERDFESGIRSGVNGTPSFFVGGKKYEGPWDEHSLTQYLKSQLQGDSASAENL